MPPLILLGAGAHAKVVIEVLRAVGVHEPVGLLDPRPAAPALLGVQVLGDEELLPRLRREGVGHAFVAIGANALRARLGRRLDELGFAQPALVHPAAFVSPSALVGEGTVVMPRAVLGTESRAGRLVILNTGTVVDHDADLGEACHIGPGCALAGDVAVGARTLVGVGSAVRPGIRIGADAVVGAGSAVVRDVAPGTRVGGAPARPLRDRA